MLPCEPQDVAAIRQQHQADFDRSERLLTLALRVLDALRVETTANDAPKSAIMGMLARAVRLYRAIQLLCERGMVEEADTLARSLFSGALAERFILHRPLPLRSCSPDLEDVRKRLPPLRRGYSAAAFRVLLHMAYPHLRMEQRVNAVMGKPGGGPLYTKARLKEIQEDAKHAEATVGTAWAAVLRRHPKTYSGLTERQMAECYRLPAYYEQVYGAQSDAVHGSNTGEYVAIASNNSWVALLTDSTRLPEALRTASSVFGLMLADANAYFRLALDLDLHKAADDFKP